MIKLLGIPYDANSSFMRGAANAPDQIRLMHQLGSSNPSTEKGGSIDFENGIADGGNIQFRNEVPALVFQQIRDEVLQLLAENDKIIALGGDHSITYPIIEAYAHRYPGLHLLHFDAHSDLYEHFDKNPFSHASPFARIMENYLVASLTQVGLRTLCSHQRRQVDRYRVKVVEMKDFSLDFLKGLNAPLYISLDLDVLDPAFAPGVSHHEPGGMTTRQLIDALHQISVPVVGADIVELNPNRDIHDMTAMVAYKLLKEISSLM